MGKEFCGDRQAVSEKKALWGRKRGWQIVSQVAERLSNEITGQGNSRECAGQWLRHGNRRRKKKKSAVVRVTGVKDDRRTSEAEENNRQMACLSLGKTVCLIRMSVSQSEDSLFNE